MESNNNEFVLGRGASPEEKEKLKKWISTWVPFDSRFPNMNKTRNCEVNYIDFHRCMKKKNDQDYCQWYQDMYKSVCPSEWVDKWDEQREKGTFPHEELNAKKWEPE